MPQKMPQAHLQDPILTLLYVDVLNMLVATTLHTQFYVGLELHHFTHSLAGLIISNGYSFTSS